MTASRSELLDVVRDPRLLAPGLERPVKVQDCVPAFAGNRLDPIATVRTGWLRPEDQVDRAVDEQAAQRQQVGEARRMGHVVAVRNLAVVARTNYEVVATGATVRDVR